MKKGFTLIEMLAVVVILALLATIAVPSAMNISKSVKEDMYCEKVDMLVADAKRWANDHLSQLREDCYIEVTVKELVENGIVKKENEEGEYITNPINNIGMDDQIIRLYKKNRRAYGYYVEADASLDGICEQLEVCAPGITEGTNGCVKRPKNKC